MISKKQDIDEDNATQPIEKSTEQIFYLENTSANDIITSVYIDKTKVEPGYCIIGSKQPISKDEETTFEVEEDKPKATNGILLNIADYRKSINKPSSVSALNKSDDTDNIDGSLNINNDALKENEIILLNSEIYNMNYRLKNSTPIPHIVYLVLTSILLTFFSLTYYIWMSKGVYIINPFISLTGIIGSITLFSTALVALKYWRLKINEF